MFSLIVCGESEQIVKVFVESVGLWLNSDPESNSVIVKRLHPRSAAERNGVPPNILLEGYSSKSRAEHRGRGRNRQHQQRECPWPAALCRC